MNHSFNNINNESELKTKIDIQEDRIDLLEKAIIQLNHFSQIIEKLNLAEWKGNVNGQLTWIKLLIGATAIAAWGQIIISLFYK